MKPETLESSVTLLERMRGLNLSVLMGLALLFIYNGRGHATQPDFARKYDISLTQASLLFKKLSRQYFIQCGAHNAPRGKPLTGSYKFYFITVNGLSIINKLLDSDDDQATH